MVIRKMIGNN